MKNFNEMNKEQLRQECREAGIKYGKMNNPEMREALNNNQNQSKPNKNKPLITYKGFDKGWKCRDFQYEMGKTFKHDGKVEACSSGFHSCEYPLDIFNYYNPCTSLFAIVESSGTISKESSDSKVASEIITLKKELSLRDLTEAAVKYTQKRATEKGEHTTGYRAASTATGYQAASTATGNQAASTATGYQAASTATGDQAASTATGYRAASTATGDRAASTATGDQAASTATGYRAASTATGDQAASTATGDQAASLTTGSFSSSKIDENGIHCVAVSCGYGGKVKAPINSALFIVERNNDLEIINVFSGIVGKNGVLPNTWYTLKNNVLTVVEE